MLERHSLPNIARILTYLGGIPFLLAVLSPFFLNNAASAELVKLVQIYAAIILSYLGGIEWGAAITHKDKKHPRAPKTFILWSITPPLIAWLSITMHNQTDSLLILTLAFTLQLIIDVFFGSKHFFEKWFINLRKQISIVVVLCLLLML